MAMTTEQVIANVQTLLTRMNELEGIQRAANLPRRVADLETRSEGYAVEHKQIHDDLEGVKRELAKAVQEITNRGKGDDSDTPGPKEVRARLDKMVEARTHITPYESVTKSPQAFKDFLEDVRDHIEHFDSELGEATTRVIGAKEDMVGDALANHLKVAPASNKALRRLLLQYTAGEAKKFIRARKDMS